MLLLYSLPLRTFSSLLSLAGRFVLLIPFFAVLFMSFPHFSFTHIYVFNKFQPPDFHIFNFHFPFAIRFTFCALKFLIQFFVCFNFSFHRVHIQLFNINLFPFICPFLEFPFYFGYRSFSWISIRKTLSVWCDWFLLLLFFLSSHCCSSELWRVCVCVYMIIIKTV